LASRRRKKEAVSVSFHYFQREADAAGGGKMIPFTVQEYTEFVSALESIGPLDLNDPDTLERLRISIDAPLEQVRRVNDRTAFGVFRSSYTGHAFHNTAKGEISANSINLRPFHFLTYLSESGRIYIGSQYLGQYGGWTGLWFALRGHLKNSASVRPYTFFSHAESYRDAQAKEVRISISKNTDRIESGNVFEQEATLVFKKHHKEDGFEQAVSSGILSQLGNIGRIKSAVAKTISANELFDISDEDIQDCTVLASVGGQNKVIYLMGDGTFATKFPLNVSVNDKGHPEYDVARNAMLKVLEEQIIRRKEIG
jgi:hypothetical protein